MKDLHSKRTEEEIIAALAGGDRTRGSCASAALAFVGQKNGWDVLDFRGGDSLKFFSSKLNKKKMFEEMGVDVIIEEAKKTSITNAKNLLEKLSDGKEYYFSAGRHAAIVRNSGGKLQYLELQSPNKGDNGWVDFSQNLSYTLHDRFVCSRSSRYVPWALAVDIDQLKGNKFRTILGYLNTESDKQFKGEQGSVK